MSETHERPTLSRNTDRDRPYVGMERYWNDVDERGSRGRSYAKITVGLAGLLADLLLASALMNGAVENVSAVVVGLIVIVVASASSVWLLDQGLAGLQRSRPSPLPHQHRSVRGSGRERQEQSTEKQLLEAIERNGEITPARAALQTSLTVDEAEMVMSDLAQRGHLDVRVEGSRLVYSL